MIDFIKRVFGLKGSFNWACKQMNKGLIVSFKNITGAVRYRFDLEGQKRIEWAFKNNPGKSDWESANMFLEDIRSVEWIVIGGGS